LLKGIQPELRRTGAKNGHCTGNINTFLIPTGLLSLKTATYFSTMANNFDIPPGNVLTHLEPFTLHVSEEELEHFRNLLEMSNIGPTTWWNQ
jgi:hypothetical protein